MQEYLSVLQQVSKDKEERFGAGTFNKKFPGSTYLNTT
jgi:hypothetical protein